MADVKIIDIDGVQWNIKDQDAKNNIAEIKETISTQNLQDPQFELASGYTCSSKAIQHHYKAGNIHFASIRIADLSGRDINTTSTTKIASSSLHPIKTTNFILRDYRAPATARGMLEPNGDIYLGESNGVNNGSNVLMGEIIFAE